jgi:hypothetical protein
VQWVTCVEVTGGIRIYRFLPVDFTGGIQCEAFVDLRWYVVYVSSCMFYYCRTYEKAASVSGAPGGPGLSERDSENLKGA